MRIQAGIFGLAAAITIALQGCEVSSPVEAGGGLEAVERLSLELCDPGNVDSKWVSSNAYFPLQEGKQWVLEGEEEGVPVRFQSDVLKDTKRVAGVSTRVVEDSEWVGGVLFEVSRNFFAEARDGTVCYFGEEVYIYDENGNIVSNEGAWLAEGGNRPGIIMPAAPRNRMQFQMEDAPGVAMDEGTIIGTGPVTVPANRFTETIRVRELNPLDGGRDIKVFAAGVGIIIDGSLELVSYR